MATDDERRRVAAALRDAAPYDTMHDDVDVGRVLHCLGLHYVDIDRLNFCGHDVNRLADLIEPAPTSSDATATHTDASATCDMSQSRRDTVACDRDALLALADEMGNPIKQAVWNQTAGVRREHIMEEYARRIREALGVVA